MGKKVIIAGSRHFTDFEFVRKTVDDFLVIAGIEVEEIVSGGARGIDALGERYAREHDYPLKRFPADWERYGRAAGSIRNKQMAEYADVLIAFSSGGKGTKNMINQMVMQRKHRHIVHLPPQMEEAC
jgi:hypothetical protein